MKTRSIEETFDATCREMSAAIGRGDLSEALSARRRAERLRERADRSGIDVEEDGGWMVPSEKSVREQIYPRATGPGRAETITVATESPLILPAPTPGPDGALIEHHLVQCVRSVPVRRLAALLGVSKATLYKIASGGGASVALLVKFGAMVGTLYPETSEHALAALGLDGALGEGWKLRGRVQVGGLPEVCPVCCGRAVTAGLARPGEVCQGCREMTRIEYRQCEICDQDTPHRLATGNGGDLPTDWDCTRCEENGSRRSRVLPCP